MLVHTDKKEDEAVVFGSDGSGGRGLIFLWFLQNVCSNRGKYDKMGIVKKKKLSDLNDQRNNLYFV